jgi:tryptophanyl-tRNA synthetase
MAIRPLVWRGTRSDLVVPKLDTEARVADPKPGEGEGDGKMTKNQQKKLEKLRMVEEKKAQKAREKEAKAGSGSAPKGGSEAS